MRGSVCMEQVIRKWRMEDKYALAALLNNPRILANLRDGIPYPYTVRDAEEFITAMLHADQTQTFAFAIVENDVVIGSAGIFRCGNIHFRTAELGYYLGETHWGRGFATPRGGGRPVPGYLRIRISCVSLRSRLPTTRLPAGCWKKRDFNLKGPCAQTR